MAYAFEEELAARYRGWQTEDLVRAVTVEAHDYTPEALDLISNELERRDCLGVQRQEAAEAVAKELDRGIRPLVGVRGFLALMVWVIAANSIAALFWAASTLLAHALPRPQVFALALAVGGILGLVTCIHLVRRKSQAPRYAATWFLLVMTSNISAFLYQYFSGGAASFPFVPVTFCGLWLAYLSVSMRVKTTYGGFRVDSEP